MPEEDTRACFVLGRTLHELYREMGKSLPSKDEPSPDYTKFNSLAKRIRDWYIPAIMLGCLDTPSELEADLAKPPTFLRIANSLVTEPPVPQPPEENIRWGHRALGDIYKKMFTDDWAILMRIQSMIDQEK